MIKPRMSEYLRSPENGNWVEDGKNVEWSHCSFSEEHLLATASHCPENSVLLHLPDRNRFSLRLSFPLGVPEKEGLAKGSVWAWGEVIAFVFPHYKLGSQTQDRGRGCPNHNALESTSVPLPSRIFFFFCTSISALIKVCLPSKLFMSVFVFPHGIVNF